MPRAGVVAAEEFFGDAAIQDPYPLYERLRAAGPVHRIGQSPFHLVCDWDAVTEVINRPEDFSSNLTATMTYTTSGGMGSFAMERLGGSTHILVTADDPIHAFHRGLVRTQFAAKHIRELEPLISRTFDQLWADGPVDGVLEWMAAVANRLPMMVVARLIGAPDADADQLARWGYASTQLLDGLMSQQELAASMAAIGELNGYIAERLVAAAADPRDDLIGVLAGAYAKGEFQRFTAQLILVSLFSAGGESTASLLGTAVAILATDADVQTRVRERPELLGPFIEETLRTEPPFRAHYRHVLRDTDLAGVELPEDSRVLLVWGAANRDPAHFESPNEFRLDRSDSKGHLTFGKGAHFCLGAALARLEATTVLRLLLERTGWFDALDVGPWLPSVLARRREFVQLAIRGHS